MPQYTLDQEQVALYKDCGLDNEYTLVSGKIVLPVATDSLADNPVDVISVCAPYRIRTVSYKAKKEGTPPVLPSPESVGPFIFLGGEIGVASPVPNSSHQFTWEVGGEYTFVCQTAPAGGFVLGNRPMIFEQQAALPVVSSNSEMPADVQTAGRGVRVGYLLGQQIDLSSPYYTYPEISYLPSVFFSSDLLSGPQNYPAFQ